MSAGRQSQSFAAAMPACMPGHILAQVLREATRERRGAPPICTWWCFRVPRQPRLAVRVSAGAEVLQVVALVLTFVLGLAPSVTYAQAATPLDETAPAAQREQLNAQTLLDQAHQAFEAGVYDRVVDLASEWLRREPASAEGYLLRGMALSEGAQDYKGAVIDLARVNRLAPEFPDVWGIRGWYLILLGRWDEAQEVIAKAQALDPDDYAWSVNLGHTYLLQGERERARRWYRRALPLVPDEASLRAGPLANFDLFIELGWQAEASREARDWFEQGWAEWQVLAALNEQVLAYYRGGQYRQAVPLAEEGSTSAQRLLGDEHPSVAARLNNLALVLKAAGRYAEAEPLYWRALAIREDVLGSEHPEVAQSLNNLAGLLKTTGRYGEAEPLLRRALAIWEKAYGGQHPEVAKSLNNLAAVLDDTGRYGEAEPLYRRALAIDERAHGRKHPDVARDLNNLASLLQTTGRYDEAEPLYRRALAIDQQALGYEHPNVAIRLNNLAGLLETTGRYSQAEPLYRRALAITEQVLGPEHPAVATSLNNLAGLLATTGSYAEAEPLHRRALAIHEQIHGPEHPAVATSLNNLAGLLATTGPYAEAEPLYRRALSITEQVHGPEHPAVATSLNNLAELLTTNGRYAEAEPLYRRALAIQEQAYGPEHPTVATSLNNLAGLLKTTARYAEAEPLYRRALAIDQQALGHEHPNVAIALGNLAGLLKTTARYAEAEPLLRRALAIHEAAHGPEHPNVATALNSLAELFVTTGRYAETEPLYRRALAIDEHAYGSEHPKVVAVLSNLAELLKITSRYAEAEALLRRALTIDEQALGPEHPDAATDLNNLAELLKTTGRYGEAEPLLRRALAITERAHGAEHPNVATVLNNLSKLLTRIGGYAEAEPLLRRALAIQEGALGPEHPNMATALNSLAELLRTAGRYTEGEPVYRRALGIFEKVYGPEHPDVATSLNNLAGLLETTGRYGEAEPLYRRALTIDEQALGPEHPDVANRLNNLADLLRTTGRYTEAYALLLRALSIEERAYGPEHPFLVMTLNNLALVLATAGRYAEAEPLYWRALSIGEKIYGSEHSDVALPLTNLALALQASGRYAEAEPLYRRALAIWEKAHGPYHPRTARGLSNLAWLLRSTNRTTEAQMAYRRSLAIAAGAGEPELLWQVQAQLSTFYGEEGHPGLAIFFGKEAVNTLQAVRRRLQSLEERAQRAFLENTAGYYKYLSELLIAQDRPAEAQQVLDMRKESEFYDYIQEDEAHDPRTTRADYNTLEAEWNETIDQTAGELTKVVEALGPLTAIHPDVRDDEEQAEIARLTGRRDTLSARFQDHLDDLIETSKNLDPSRQEALNAEMDERPGNKRDLLAALSARSGSPTGLLQYLLLEDKVRLLLTTPEGWHTAVVEVPSDTLAGEIRRLRKALTTPASVAETPAQALYQHLVAPLAEEIDTAGLESLLVHLDGRLRYIPFAALHDGTQWLAERWALTYYTAASERQAEVEPADWRVAGFGTSRAHTGFAALTAVAAELDGIVDEGADDPTGVLPGRVHLDAAFTETVLLEEAADRVNRLLHIATHFDLKPGNDSQSSLLLGNGERISLRALRTAEPPLDLRHIDLVTLSACNTAMGGADTEGAEIEGMGTIVQRQGARGVLASLWSVADASTGELMQTLYRLRRERPELTKARALQQAQLMLMGSATADAGGAKKGGSRGVILVHPSDAAQRMANADRRYAHPYYWAPFILMGNWL